MYQAQGPGKTRLAFVTRPAEPNVLAERQSKVRARVLLSFHILATVLNVPSTPMMISASMYPSLQYCLVGTLFLISAVVMAVSSIIGQTHSQMDVLVIVFSVISFFVACDQFWRAFAAWHATKMKLAAVESQGQASISV